jgi:hypothetical protein
MHSDAEKKGNMERRELTLASAKPILCTECGREWVLADERWLVKFLDESPPQAVPYCPDCHEREFG